MTVVPAPGTERGSPFVDALHMVGTWPVAQLGAPMIYYLARCAAAGATIEQLALGFEIEERDVATLCCHFGIGVRRGAKHLEPLNRTLHAQRPPARHPVQPSFLELSQPREPE